MCVVYLHPVCICNVCAFIQICVLFCIDSPAPEYVLSKKQCNGDLLKELFPDSDEENEKPTENAGAGCSSSNTSSSLMESLVTPAMSLSVCSCDSNHGLLQVGCGG